MKQICVDFTKISRTGRSGTNPIWIWMTPRTSAPGAAKRISIPAGDSFSVMLNAELFGSYRILLEKNG